jgi:hypothetical protein
VAPHFLTPHLSELSAISPSESKFDLNAGTCHDHKQRRILSVRRKASITSIEKIQALYSPENQIPALRKRTAAKALATLLAGNYESIAGIALPRRDSDATVDVALELGVLHQLAETSGAVIGPLFTRDANVPAKRVYYPTGISVWRPENTESNAAVPAINPPVEPQ